MPFIMSSSTLCADLQLQKFVAATAIQLASRICSGRILTPSERNKGNRCDDQKSYLIDEYHPLYVKLRLRTPAATESVGKER